MERWIDTAWRAFWVGLGASAVLIGNSLFSPGLPGAAAGATSAEIVAPDEAASEPARLEARPEAPTSALTKKRAPRTLHDPS